MMSELRERIAAIVHKQWAHWMKYQLDRVDTVSDGYLLYTPDVERWARQARTPYDRLTEQEKASDREWADKYLAEFIKPVPLTAADIHWERGRLDLVIEHPMAPFIIQTLVGLYKASDAANYLQLTLYDDDGKYTVLIQRRDGLTPHEKAVYWERVAKEYAKELGRVPDEPSAP